MQVGKSPLEHTDYMSAAINPVDTVLREQCDVIEHNRFFDAGGSEVFQQIIFWEFKATEFVVRDWRMVKQPSQLPIRDHATGDYVATWLDGDKLRQVRARDVRETWTQADPELAERERLPKEMRRGLRVELRRELQK